MLEVCRLAKCLLVASYVGAAAAAAAPGDRERLLAERLMVTTNCTEVTDIIKASGEDGSRPRILQALRRAVFGHPGEKHRQKARERLLLMLIGVPLGGEACARDSSPAAREALQAAFAATDAKSSQMLLEILNEKGAPSEALLRLVAANSLALTGVVPTPNMLASLQNTLRREEARENKIEELIALGAFAERSHVAYADLQKALLGERDCRVAEGVATNLPSYDIGLVMFKRLAGDASPRAKQLRTWIKSKRGGSCK